MLEELTLLNFQRWKRKVIKFDPYVTCLVGPSERGKSSCIRGLLWLCLNEWNSPKEDITDDGTTSKAILLVDGRRIVRKHSEGKNLYRLDNQVYRAFGTKVPDAISKLLNVSEINFQQQHEPHFWLSASPAQVSRELNAIVDLEVIDSSLSELASDTRRAKLAYEINKESYSKAKEEKQTLEWTVDANDKMEFLLDLDRQLQNKRRRIEGIDRLLSDIRQHKTIQKNWEEFGRHGEEIVSKGDRLAEIQERKRKLIILLASIDITERASRLSIPKLPPDPAIRISRLSELIEQIEEQEWLLCQTCPTCGQTIPSLE